jgi:hypothetical protein
MCRRTKPLQQTPAALLVPESSLSLGAAAAAELRRSAARGHMATAATVRIGAIVVHCHVFDRMVAFWQGALRYEPREPVAGGWAVLRDPTGDGPHLSLQARDRRAGRRSWLHLDLYTTARDRDVERLLGLGAKR